MQLAGKALAGVGSSNGDRGEVRRGVPSQTPAPGERVAVLNVPAGCAAGAGSSAGRLERREKRGRRVLPSKATSD